MKLPDFDHSKKKWDRYNASYVPHHGRWSGDGVFIQFESGELMVTRNNLKPHERQEYDRFGCYLTYTTDAMFQFYLPDGTKIPTAWLTQGGSQTLLVDLERKRAYRVAPSYRGEAYKQLPTHAKTSCLYFANVAADPIISKPIHLARPDNAFKAEHKKWMNDVRAACAAIDRIKGQSYVGPYKHKLTPADVAKPVEQYISELPAYGTSRIAQNGFQLNRAVIEVPYLTIA